VIYRLLAALVAILHIGYALFVAVGAFIVLKYPSILWLHLVCVAWACGTTIMDLGCPVTPLEKRLWAKGGREPYETGFINKYILRSNASGTKSHTNHIILGVVMGIWNIALYSFLF
jgi:hypothetical protein